LDERPPLSARTLEDTIALAVHAHAAPRSPGTLDRLRALGCPDAVLAAVDA
jgi:hypothetical protein